MKSIWKYPIGTTDYQEIDMPKGAEILCVQTQDKTPCLWALVDSEKIIEKRIIIVYGTGHPVKEERKYIGTYQLNEGRLVFHVFERTQ